MEGFRSYSGYKVGASHIAKHMGCEDYAATYDDEKVSIAVISDGHGDKKCFRSAQGAHIACDVSIESVKDLIESSDGACNVLKKSPDRIITELERRIIREWNKAVSNDIIINPITDNELDGMPADVVDAIRNGKIINKIYGCTLIMCVVVEGFWFGIHIGDGKCVVAMNNGLYTQPIPWDEVGCVGNRSTSICNSNSYAGFRYIYGTDVPVGLFVASDGVDESFDESGLNRCYYTLGYWVQTLKKEELDLKMDELLSQITNNGSGDDVSIACIVSESKEIRKPYASSEQVAEKLLELIHNIKDKEEHFDNLTESKMEIQGSIDELKSEIEEFKRKIAVCEERITEKRQELDNIDNNIQSVITLLQKSVSQLPKAKDTKERIDQYWKENGVDIKEDAELDYYPRYSEEYLGNVLNEIEGLRKVARSEGEPMDSGMVDINESKKHDDNIIDANSNNAGELVGVETEESVVTRPAMGNDCGGIAESIDIQLVDKADLQEDEPKSNSQKTGLFGGLFGKRK